MKVAEESEQFVTVVEEIVTVFAAVDDVMNTMQVEKVIWCERLIADCFQT